MWYKDFIDQAMSDTDIQLLLDILSHKAQGTG